MPSLTHFLLLPLVVLTPLFLNWLIFYRWRVSDCSSQKKGLIKFLSQTKAIELWDCETGMSAIVVSKKFSHLSRNKKLTPEFYIEVSRPKRVDNGQSFWGEDTYYREFAVCTSSGVFLRSYKVIDKN